MDEATLQTLGLISVAAVLTVIMVDRFPGIRLNVVVLELLAGILLGPVLHAAKLTPIVLSFSSLGLAFLMFSAGYEIDFTRIKGRPLKLSVSGWLISLVLGLGAGYLLQYQGRVLNGLVAGLALTTTALGTMLPMWRDAGLLRTPFGTHALSIGTAGEFGPIVAIALLLGDGAPLRVLLLLLAFVLLAVGATALAMRPRAPRTLLLMSKHLNSSDQLPVRIAVLIVVLLLWVASSLGLDVLLGAFSAGIIVRLGAQGTDEETLRSKLEAIGFGFLIPIFFVVSGIAFDLPALVHNPLYLLHIPLFMVLFFIVRGIPVLILYRKDLIAAERTAMVWFSATALPLVVAITTLGVRSHEMKRENAAALVAAAMLSVVIYPTVGFARLRRFGLSKQIGMATDSDSDATTSEMGEA